VGRKQEKKFYKCRKEKPPPANISVKNFTINFMFIRLNLTAVVRRCIVYVDLKNKTTEGVENDIN
tara:strand:+ start:596 stop:790 length:195 start_codon:yes stop_codon:yes gene_type:complete